MIKFGCWNTRGLNDTLKQREVRSFISDNNLSLIGLVETHVQFNNSARIRRSICDSCSFLDNYINNASGRI